MLILIGNKEILEKELDILDKEPGRLHLHKYSGNGEQGEGTCSELLKTFLLRQYIWHFVKDGAVFCRNEKKVLPSLCCSS